MKDLRTFIADLEKAGLLLEISKEVDPDENMGILNWEAVTRLKKAVIYKNIKGYPGWRAVAGIMGTRQNALIALAPGLPIGHLTNQLAAKLREQHSLERPRLVDGGPVKDIIRKGADVDLGALPAHIVQEGDAGRYIGSAFLVCRDPESGIQNLAMLRHQIKGRARLGIMMAAGKHTSIIYDKYRKRGKPMPVSIVNGHHGALILASTWSTSLGIDEYTIANVLLGARLEVCRSETNDLEVPARAEVVLEGEIPCEEREEEGPFGEHTGCTFAGTGMNPVVDIKAITMRRDPIWYQITEGPLTDGAILDSIPMEVQLFNRLRDVGGYVDLKNVVVMECGGGGHLAVVQMVPRVAGEAKGVLMAALSSNYLHTKIAVAVDDDVDPYDPAEVVWAIATKVNPREDVFIVEGTPGHSLDGSLKLLTPKGQTPVMRIGSRMGIDATKPPTCFAEERRDLEKIRAKGFGRHNLAHFVD